MAIGIAWTLFGAVLLGVFALPSKYVKNYQWENTWGSFFLFAMYVVPVGFFTGEWKGADQKSKNLLFAGLAVLIVGIVIVSLGNAKITAMATE